MLSLDGECPRMDVTDVHVCLPGNMLAATVRRLCHDVRLSCSEFDSAESALRNAHVNRTAGIVLSASEELQYGECATLIENLPVPICLVADSPLLLRISQSYPDRHFTWLPPNPTEGLIRGILDAWCCHSDDCLQDRYERLETATVAAGIYVWDSNLRTGETFTLPHDFVFRAENGALRVATPDVLESFVHPDDLSPFLKGQCDIVGGNTDRLDLEFRIRDKSGGWQWASCQMALFRDGKGEPSRVIGVGYNIDQRKAVEELLARRVQYEEALAACAYVLFSNRNTAPARNGVYGEHVLAMRSTDYPGGAVQAALQFLLNATLASRAYIFEGYADPELGPSCRQVIEVCAKDVESQIHLEDLQRLPCTSPDFVRAYDELRADHPVMGLVTDFEGMARNILETQGVRSILMLPIWLGSEWYGFIGFDDVKDERRWREEDVRLLRTAARIIGTYIENARALAALRLAEQRYRDVFENSAMGIFRVDESFRYTMMNNTFAQMLGFDSAEAALAELRSLACVPFMTDAMCEAILNLAADADEIGSVCENRFVRPDGSAGVARVHIRLIRNPDGSVEGAEGFAEDITEGAEAKEKLRDAYRQLNDVVDFFPDPTFIIDQEHRVVAWNQAIEEFTGFRREDILGKGDYAYGVPFYGSPRPLLADLVMDRATDVSTNNYSRFSWKGTSLHAEKSGWISADKVPRDLWILAAPLVDFDGKVVGAIETIRDITEFKKSENTLRRLATAVEQTAEAIIITDARGLIEYVNSAFERMSGYSHAEVHGLAPEIVLQSQGREDVSRPTYWNAGFAGAWAESLINKRKDGSAYRVEATVSPIHNGEGDIVNYVCVHRDVTQEVTLEEQLRQSQKMEAIGTLAGGIAHDFNNILSAIIGFASLAQSSIPQESRAQEDMREVLGAAERARSLIKQILTFSRQVKVQQQPVEVHFIVREALKLIRAGLPSTIEIKDAISRDSGVVMGDPTQIHQVLMNLCTNASHVMQSGGGTLAVELVALEVAAPQADAIQDLHEGPYICLVVRDTGAGMDRATLDRIFEPFFTTKPLGQGTGMGLSTVHGIVKQMGGAIVVSSEPGIGTEFRVYLPRYESSSASATGVVEEMPGGCGERILYVDDEEILARMAERALEMLGYKATIQTSSQIALNMFRENPASFDLVITDQTMPVMTGLQLAQEIHAIRADIPIILVSGFTEVITPDILHKEGISEFLAKPIVPTELAQAIRRVLA